MQVSWHVQGRPVAGRASSSEDTNRTGTRYTHSLPGQIEQEVRTVITRTNRTRGEDCHYQDKKNKRGRLSLPGQIEQEVRTVIKEQAEQEVRTVIKGQVEQEVRTVINRTGRAEGEDCH